MALLSDAEKTALLKLARVSIEDALLGGGCLASALASIELTPPLLEPRGAFVTLTDRRVREVSGAPRLRGCIGTIEAHEPLHRSVVRNAAHAAQDDPRFPPVGVEDLPHLVIEISALTQLVPVDGPGAILIGRDGVELEKDAHRAVFLPQVALAQGWDATQLLEHLARKAGLPPDAWRHARLRTFGADVFGEGEEPFAS